MSMYKNIKEFKDYIKSADDKHIEKIIDYINIAGYYDGDGTKYEGSEVNLAREAIEYAESYSQNVRDYLIEIGYMFDEY